MSVPGRTVCFGTDEKGYFTDSAYTVVNVCVLEDNDRVTGTRLEQILSKLSSHIRCNYNGILCCAQDKQILLVLCDYSDEACRKTTERIFRYYAGWYVRRNRFL